MIKPKAILNSTKKLLKNIVSKPQGFEDIIDLCDKNIVKQNRRRLIIAAAIIFVLEIALLTTLLIDYLGGNPSIMPNFGANAVFTILLTGIFMIAVFVKNDMVFIVSKYVFVFLTLVLSVLLSFFDSQTKSNGEVAAYIMVLLMVASALIFRPHIFLSIQAFIFVTLFVLFAAFRINMIISDYTNIFISNVFAAFIVYYGFHTSYKSTGNKILV
ncbi:MAG: hypothetical protein FWD86_04030, partial [Firmicutes bacterium]|nr:hypothetical protein [Bacillota bacterium]